MRVVYESENKGKLIEKKYHQGIGDLSSKIQDPKNWRCRFEYTEYTEYTT